MNKLVEAVVENTKPNLIELAKANPVITGLIVGFAVLAIAVIVLSVRKKNK